MVIDTSAILAIFLAEPEADAFLESILAATKPKMSAGNYLELCLKVDHKANALSRLAFDEFFEKLNIRIEPVSVRQIGIARKANQIYGKGSGHSAKLNFGDCLAYALAKDVSEPLLFKGKDFVHTDLKFVI